MGKRVVPFVLAVSALFLLVTGALASAATGSGARAGHRASSQATAAPTPPLAPSPTVLPAFTPAPAAPTAIPAPRAAGGMGLDTLVVVALALLVIAVSAMLYIRNK